MRNDPSGKTRSRCFGDEDSVRIVDNSEIEVGRQFAINLHITHWEISTHNIRCGQLGSKHVTHGWCAPSGARAFGEPESIANGAHQAPVMVEHL